MKFWKKLFCSLIIINIIFILNLQNMNIINTVQAAQTITEYEDVYVWTDYEYEQYKDEATTFKKAFIRYADPPTPDAELISSQTLYKVAYKFAGPVRIPKDYIDAYSKGKTIRIALADWKIQELEYVREDKDDYIYRVELYCNDWLTGYVDDVDDYRDFKPLTIVSIYKIQSVSGEELLAYPQSARRIRNTRKWHYKVKKETKTEDGKSFFDSLNKLIQAGLDGLDETTKKINENYKNLEQVEDIKKNKVQNDNSSKNQTQTISTKLDHSDMSDDARRLYIRNLYKRVLKREPANSEIDAHFNYNSDVEAINIIFSTEANNKNAISKMTNDQFIEACYKFLLNRSADDSGKKTWGNYLANGKSRAELISTLIQSTEFKNLNKQTITTITLDKKLCDACYNSLIETGFAVIKPTDTTIKMYSTDVDKVKSLNLNGKGLTTITGLKQFKKLEKLNLSNNKITDLSELSSLSNLQDLDISKNSVTSLESIRGLTNLTRLYANGNNIETVTGLSGMTKLKSLSLSECNVKQFTANISNLTQLEEIKIENNQLDNTSLAKIAAASNLKRLHISKNKITSLESLSGLTKLEEINADNNMISNISKFGKIRQLRLRNNSINITTIEEEIDIPSVLSEIMDSKSVLYTQSSNINCENCKIENGKIVINPGVNSAKITIKDGSAVNTKINIKNVVKVVTVKDRVLAERLKTEFGLDSYAEKDGKFQLSISESKIYNKKAIDLSTPSDSENKITDISGLESFENLTMIDLSNNQISNFEPLSNLKKLQTLVAKFNSIRNFDSLKKLTGLKQLDVSNNRIENLTGIENMTKLEDLILSNNNIQNNLASLNSLKDNLKILALNNNKISDISGLSQLKLEKLYLDYNEITDASQINTSKLDTFRMENNIATITTSEGEIDLPGIIRTDINKNGGTSNLKCIGCTINDNKIVLDEGEIMANVDILSGTYKDSRIVIYDSNALDGPELTVSYDLNNSTTQMTVTVRSNKKVLPLLGWDISENSTCLTKTFSYNVSNQIIVVTDTYGNKTEQLIEFTGVHNPDIPDLTVSYDGKMLTKDDVTVTVSSSVKLYHTTGWTSSDDGKSLSKTFSDNTNHAFTTIPFLTEEMFNQQKPPKEIQIPIAVIDKVAPELRIEYSTTSITKDSVRVTVWAEEEIEVFGKGRYSKDVFLQTNGTTWYGLVFYFSDNADEEVIIRDRAGNTSSVIIHVNNIDKGVDGLYSRISQTNATRDNVLFIVGADETITVNRNNQAKLNRQNIVSANVNRMINVRNILNSNNYIYTMANNNEYLPGYTNILLAENDDENNTQTGNQIEIELSEREHGTLEVTDAASNTEIVLYNSSVIDREDIELVREDTYNDDGSVSVKLKSNRPLKSTESLGGWELSEDGLELTQTFNKNHKDVLHLQDFMDNELDYEISIDGFKNINYTIHYIPLTGTDEVTVIITCDVEIEPVDGWEISEDGKIIATTINMYNKQIITLYDTKGNSEDVTIEYDPDVLNLDVEQTDDSQADKLLPNTGKQNAIKITIAIMIAITLFVALRRRKRTIYRNKIKKN